MKRSKIITVLTYIMTLCALAFCFTIVNPINAKATTNTEYTIYSSGIALTDNVDAGLSVTYNTTAGRDQTYSTTYGAFAFKFSETIDASADGDYDGLLIKMANKSVSKIKFVNYLVSEGKIGRCASSTDKEYKTFIDDTGANLATDDKGVEWKGSYYFLTEKTEGTFNLDFSDIKSGRPDMNSVSEIVFGLRMDEALNEGVGFTIGTIAAYKKDDSATGGYSVKVLFDANQMTVSTDQTVTTADINLADMSKGKTVYFKGVANGSNQFITENADTINEWAMGYLNVSIASYLVTMHCEDANGVVLQNPTAIKVYAGRQYTLTAPTFSSFEYVSADKGLTGVANSNTDVLIKYNATSEVTVYTLTVKYVDASNNTIKTDLVKKYLSGVDYVVETPEIRGYVYKSVLGGLEGTISANTTVTLSYDKIPTNWDVTEVEWAVSDSEDSLYIKGSLFGGVQFMNNAQMALIADDQMTHGRTILGLTKFNFSRDINAINGDWDGLLIKIENISDKPLKFSGYLLNGDLIARNFISSDNRYEKFVENSGFPLNEMEKGIQVASTYYTFSAGASGTWNYEFSELKTGKENMTEADAFAIGLRQGETAYMGKGIVISSIAAYKADDSYPNGYYVETLFNARDLSVTSQEGDTSADLNLTDTDLGRIVNTNIYCTNNTNSFVAEEYRENLHQTVLYNTSFEQRGYVVKVNHLDSAGDLLKTDIYNYAPNSEYTFTPASIPNFVFDFADEELSGIVSSDMEINLYYKLAKYTVTVRFVDEEDNEIKADWVKEIEAGEYLVCDPNTKAEFTVEGYTYKSTNGRLKFTVVRDTTIVLTFTKNSGCSSNLSSTLGISLFALSVVAVVLVVKNKKKV